MMDVSMLRTAALACFLGFGLAGTAQAVPVSLAGIEDEEFFTIFNDTGSNAVAGQPYTPSSAENLIADIADFGDVGRVAFINSPPYYLVNPNAWAFAGADTAFINFDTGIQSVSIAARVTAEGDTPGPNGLFPYPGVNNGGTGDPFVDGEGTVWALDIDGNRIGVAPIESAPLQGTGTLAEEINFTAADLGELIYGLEFEQSVDDVQAGLFLGGLGITAAPEPHALALLTVAGLALVAVRRRRAPGSGSETATA